MKMNLNCETTKTPVEVGKNSMHTDLFLNDLLSAVSDAVKWFSNYNNGTALNGPSDAILVPRHLHNAAMAVRDGEAVAVERLANVKKAIESFRHVYLNDNVADELLSIANGQQGNADMRRRK